MVVKRLGRFTGLLPHTRTNDCARVFYLWIRYDMYRERMSPPKAGDGAAYYGLIIMSGALVQCEGVAAQDANNR